MTLLTMAMPGCGGKRMEVRDSDVVAWSGAHIQSLQVHPLFSTMPRSTADVAGGFELWTYHECRKRSVECSTTAPNQFTGRTNTVCSGGGESCCHHQFLINGARVEWYRPVGRCGTDCRSRPQQSCAQPIRKDDKWGY